MTFFLTKGIYFNVNLIFVLISVILTILVLNFHFRGPKKRRVPKFFRKYVIGYLGRLVCFGLESKAYDSFQAEESLNFIDKENNFKSPDHDLLKSNSNTETNSKNILILNSNLHDKSFKVCEKDLVNNHINKPKAHFANSNNAENYIIMDKSIKDSSVLPMILNLKSCSNYFSNKKKLIKSEKLSESSTNNKNELLKGLEGLLKKIDESLLKSDLKYDNNFKVSLLKEISECQLNLLNTNKLFQINEIPAKMKDKNEFNELKVKSKLKSQHKLTLDQIYDEWKLIALIMDRTCFFLYFSFLVISSVLFLFSQQDASFISD